MFFYHNIKRTLLLSLIAFSISFSYAQEHHHRTDLKNQRIIQSSIFLVSYNEVYEQPNWMRYHVRDIKKKFDRKGMRFYTVDSVHTSDDHDYYKNPWDKGHIAPAAAFTDSHENLYATFSYLNCTLQKDRLNQGAWAALEREVRALAQVYGPIEVEVVVDFKPGHQILETGAHIPSGFWKTLCYSNGIERCFYFPNEDPTNDWEGYEVFCVN